MARWVESLDGLEVKVTGDFRQTELGLTQRAVERLLRQHGARVVSEVRRTTDLLIRADSPSWKYVDFGAREERLSKYQDRAGSSGVLDVDDLVELLAGRPVWARDPSSPPHEVRTWAPYRRATPSDLAESETITVRDSDAVEAALEGHASTQNALADLVGELGCNPLSPRGQVRFDLAWEVDDWIWVAEVKSLVGGRESEQLRIGLGQVLEYSWRLHRELDRPIQPVLAVEREVTDSSWMSICEAVEVLLLWAPTFQGIAEGVSRASGPGTGGASQRLRPKRGRLSAG